MRYSTAAAFRDALEHRLNTRATERQIAVNVLRKQAAIDRFLARLAVAAPGRWVAKGAYAIDLRLGSRGRATRDVDLERSDDAEAALHDMRAASAVDLGDYFRFGVERSRQRVPHEHDRAVRFLVAADLAGRRFDNFTVDVALGEPLVAMPDLIDGPDLLAFAGIPRTRVPAIPLEVQIAEKVHAYTRVYRAGRRNTRVKDLVDLAYIARISTMDGEKLSAALRRTFATRRAHEKPEALPPPPAEWAVPYRLLAETLGLPAELAQGYRIAAALVDPVLEGDNLRTWNPAAQRWRAPSEHA